MPFLPAVLPAQTKPAKIEAVEIWRVRGHRETVRGSRDLLR